MSANWQRRWQPLLEQWVLISARSAGRPWSGALAKSHEAEKPTHDPDCYLCPRVTRANGVDNPDYSGAFAFDNDFPSLSFEAPGNPSDAAQSVQTRTAPAHGHCRVLCWSEKHDATLASLTESQMTAVVHLWKTEYEQLSKTAGIANVLIFENKGVEIGVSNLHPHGQIYATDFVTDTAYRMRQAQVQYTIDNQGDCLMLSLLQDTHTQAQLIVEKGSFFSVVVPFAARFAYETWIVPHRQVSSLAQMGDAELHELGMLYQRQVRRYDLLFKRSAPNVTLMHNAPCADEDANLNQHWCFHLAFHPPLRDPEKLKFLAGFESGSNNIVNPVQPELAASQLRAIDTSEWCA